MKTKLVFLVDDDELFSEIMSNYLKKEFTKQYQIRTYKSGEECIDNLYLKPDIIILDYFLDSANENAVDGLTTLKKIKEISKKTEVVILTKNDNEEVAMYCLKNGAADYIIKNNVSHVHMHLTLQNINKKLHALASAESSKYSTWIAIGLFVIVGVIGVILNLIFTGYLFSWKIF